MPDGVLGGASVYVKLRGSRRKFSIAVAASYGFLAPAAFTTSRASVWIFLLTSGVR